MLLVASLPSFLDKNNSQSFLDAFLTSFEVFFFLVSLILPYVIERVIKKEISWSLMMFFILGIALTIIAVAHRQKAIYVEAIYFDLTLFLFIMVIVLYIWCAIILPSIKKKTEAMKGNKSSKPKDDYKTIITKVTKQKPTPNPVEEEQELKTKVKNIGNEND